MIEQHVLIALLKTSSVSETFLHITSLLPVYSKYILHIFLLPNTFCMIFIRISFCWKFMKNFSVNVLPLKRRNKKNCVYFLLFICVYLLLFWGSYFNKKLRKEKLQLRHKIGYYNSSWISSFWQHLSCNFEKQFCFCSNCHSE